MTTEAPVKVCVHMEADSRGAKVRLPSGELACFRCYLDGVFEAMGPIAIEPIRVVRRWLPHEDALVRRMVIEGYTDREIGCELGRSENAVTSRLSLLRQRTTIRR